MYACGGDLPRDQLQYQQHYADTVLHHGEDSREAAQALLYLGAIYLAGFRLEEAEASARRALTIYESRAGKSSPEAGRALVELGSILGQEGQLARATPVLRRAIQLMQTGGSAFEEIGRAHV